MEGVFCKMAYVKCHICYHNNTDKATMNIACERCGADFLDKDSEKRIAEGGTMAMFSPSDKATDWHQTELYLTDKRLLIIPIKMEGFGLTQAITAAIVNKMMPGVTSLPLEHIQSISESVRGMGPFKSTVIVINTTDNMMVKIDPTKKKLEQWKAELAKYV
jgi:DNA-directed RNA polymerase subunit RPC12/RpoP